MFDLLFDAHTYMPVYITFDSGMKELKRTQYEDELNGIINKNKKLEEVTKLN